MKRTKWLKRALAGVLAVGAAGCKQQLFLEPGDYHDALKVQLPKALETNPHDPIVPGTVEKLAPVNTVADFARPPRNLTLRECVAVAIEQGNIGSQAQQASQFGFKSEGLGQFTGRGASGTDSVRAFAVDPAIAGAEVERSLSKFDTRWVTTMQWQKIDQPVAAQFVSFQQQRDAATLSSTLAKPLPTGGVAGITFSTDYSKFGTAASQQFGQLINPNYTPRLQFTFEQPLLRLFGVEINQIAGTGPFSEGSLLLGGIRPAGGVGTEGILITRIRQDQTKADFEAKINFLLVNVEAAYWNLYAAYYNLYAQEEGYRQAYEGYRYTKTRVEIGSDEPQRLHQIQAQVHRFQGQVIQARGQVLESERQLRGLMGLRSDDGTRLVPIDEPTLAAYTPDFHEAANEAIALRPELVIARADLKFRQLDILLQKNLRRPDLRTFTQYDVAGLGTRLGGNTQDFNANTGVFTPGNAFGSLADNRFNSWTIGFRFDVPIGFRDANALVRQAQLNLTKSYVQLRDTELKTVEFLISQYRRLIQTHVAITYARAEREELQKFVYRIKLKEQIGGGPAVDFLSNLTVQQQLAAAIAAEARAIADYNSALAIFEFAKGTIQQYNAVAINEGPLPPWVQKRAADHIRERTEAALKLREAPIPAGGGTVGGHPVGPANGTNSALKLPPFAEAREPLPDLPVKPMTPPVPPLGGGAATGTRPWPTAGGPAGTGDAPRPLPTFGTAGGSGAPAGVPLGAPVSGAPVEADNTFSAGDRVVLPPPPQGARPIGTALPAPPAPPSGTGTGAPGEFFAPAERVTLPPPPKPLPVVRTPEPIVSPGAPAVPSAPGILPDGRVTLPPPPAKGEPLWTAPSAPSAPAAPDARVAPPAPIIPPTLPGGP
jgi:outer membrane protein TolC